MNLEGFAGVVFGAMIFAFTAVLAVQSGDSTAIAAIWLAIGSGYCAQVCFYSFVHKPWALKAGITFWIASVALVLTSFWVVIN